MANNPPIGFGSFGPQKPVRATSRPNGVPPSDYVVTDPHDLPLGGKPMGTKTNDGFRTSPVGMSPSQVRAMQQFLSNHGFQVTQDGVFGPQTQSAAAAFRANHKGGAAWSAKNGIGVHPAVKGTTPHGNPSDAVAPPTPAPARSTADAGSTGGTSDVFGQLLSALLAGGGQVGTMADAKSFGDAAAAPSDALASAYQRQIAANPADEKQHQFDISSWYGLDPAAKSYQLSVLGRLGQARTRDAEAATDASSNIGDIAKSLAGSIGGAANDGSSTVLGAGANAAGTMAALGEESKQFADDMAPLLEAEARGAQGRERASNSHTLMDLQDRLAGAQGQSKSDRAAAVLSVLDKNNGLAQQRFANEGNLLSTLAQLQSVDPNATGLKDAKLKAQIREIQARTGKLLNPTVKAGAVPHLDLAQAGNSVAGLLGVGNDHVLPDGVSVTKLAYTIGSQLQGLGLKKGTPGYQRAAQTLISMFKDGNGNPVVPPASWFGPNS